MELFWCAECEPFCECGGDFMDFDSDEGFGPECPCCGSGNVAP
jgi:MoaA/NifB/PqqE/SkfB family radical SAM enzyme